MEKYKRGTIIYIAALEENVNPETGYRNLADFGLVMNSDENTAYFLPIMKYKEPYVGGRYIELNKNYVPNSSKNIEGYIDLKYVYKTDVNQYPQGMIFNELFLNDIEYKRNEYLKFEEIYKPVIRTRK